MSLGEAQYYMISDELDRTVAGMARGLGRRYVEALTKGKREDLARALLHNDENATKDLPELVITPRQWEQILRDVVTRVVGRYEPDDEDLQHYEAFFNQYADTIGTSYYVYQTILNACVYR